MKEATRPAQEPEGSSKPSETTKAAAGAWVPSWGEGRCRRPPGRPQSPPASGETREFRAALRSPCALTFFSTLLFLGRLSRVCAIILFSRFPASFKGGVMSLSGGNGVARGVEGTLSPPITPALRALLLPKLQSLKLSACQVFGLVLRSESSLTSPGAQGFMRPSFYPPKLPLPRGILLPSCPGRQQSLLPAPQAGTCLPVLSTLSRGSPPSPLSLPSPACTRRTHGGDLSSLPLGRESGRLARGSDRDRLRTGMGFNSGGSDENKSGVTGRAEIGQGRSGGSLLSLCRPAAPGLGPS